MTLLEIITTSITVIASIVALVVSLRKVKLDTREQDNKDQKAKQELEKMKHDLMNQDVDTIDSLYDTLKKQDVIIKEIRAEFCQYKEDAEKEFADYKTTVTKQIAEIAGENVRLWQYIKKLIAQLEAAGIVPEKYKID